MTIPSENLKIMKNLGRVDNYTWDKPARIPARVNLTSYSGAKYMLDRGQDFKVNWGPATAFVMDKGGHDFMLSVIHRTWPTGG